MSQNFDQNYLEELIEKSLAGTIDPNEQKLLTLFLKYGKGPGVDRLVERAFLQEKTNLPPSQDRFDILWDKLHPVQPLHSKPQIVSILRYAAAILLFLSIPMLLFRTEMKQALQLLPTQRQPVANEASIHVIPKSNSKYEDVLLTLSPDNAKTLNTDSNREELQLSHAGVEITQKAHSITYEKIAGVSLAANIYHQVQVPAGKTMDVQMTDGTKITLNAGSSLRYPIAMERSEVRVTLQGEAYFDVAHLPNRRFIVEVSGNKLLKKHQIEVLGTQFNIKANPNDPSIKTTLIQGKIQARGLSKDLFVLQPNQELTVDQGVTIRPADLTSATAWRNRTFYLKNVGLDELCRELSRWYNVEIAYDKSLENLRFHIDFSKDKPLDELLAILALDPQVSIIRTNSQIQITNKN